MHKSTFIDKEFKKYISEIDTTSPFVTQAIKQSVRAGRTIGEIYKHYCTWCDHNNKKIARETYKEIQSAGTTTQDTADVSVMSSGQVSRGDPEILDQCNTEAERLMNDVEIDARVRA